MTDTLQFRAEVDTGEGKWYTNALRFDTEDAATTYATRCPKCGSFELHLSDEAKRKWS